MDNDTLARRCRLIRQLLASEAWQDYLHPLLEARATAIKDQLTQRLSAEDTARLREEHLTVVSLMGRPAADLSALLGSRSDKEDD